MASESDYLSAAEIEAIDANYKIRVGLGPVNETEVNVGRLLAHLRALAAPADAAGKVAADIAGPAVGVGGVGCKP